MRTFAFLALFLSLLATPLYCVAQTDYSLRIRSLDVTFAGLLDDFLTDVYLNPARLAELDSSMVYGATLPTREEWSPFPTMSLYRWSRERIEDQYWGWGTDAVALGFFGVLAGKTAYSINAEFGLASGDSWDDRFSSYPYSDTAEIVKEGNGYSWSDERYAIDIAIAPLTTGNALGVRIKGTLDRSQASDALIRERTGWVLVDPANLQSSYESNYITQEYERIVLNIAAGYSRPSGRLSEAVAGAHYLEERRDDRGRVYEYAYNDADGNGIGYRNYPVEVSYAADAIDSERDYTGFGGFFRVHLRWTEKLRSAHFAGWSRSTGDGEALMRERDEESNYWEEESLEYAYDGGTLDRGFIQSSLGFHEMLFDQVLVAVGVDGRYARTSFDENADGEFHAGNSTGWEFESPYRQNHDNADDALSVAFPVGLEWLCHKYLKLRIGGAFLAYRNESDKRLTNNVPSILGSPAAAEYGGLEFVNHDLRADVDARFNTGLEFNVNDRFIVDLATYGSSTVLLAQYYELSARFRF